MVAAVRRYNLALLAIAGAWVVSIWAEMSGVALRLHHDQLVHGGLPLWEAAVLLLVAWQVMTVAMMLPSSLPMVRLYANVSRGKPEQAAGMTLFLASYFGVWTAFALVAFTGDVGVHRLVDRWPWLAANTQLIPAGVFAIAAVYQLTPLKDACLRACRQPAVYLLRYYRRGAVGGLRLGFGHAIFCLGCCWALMLVMFAAGVAHLYWMVVLALIMLIEKAFPDGNRITYPVGGAFALLAITALIAPAALPR